MDATVIALGRLDVDAMRALALAREEASVEGQELIGPNHILLGILHQAAGIAPWSRGVGPDGRYLTGRGAFRVVTQVMRNVVGAVSRGAGVTIGAGSGAAWTSSMRGSLDDARQRLGRHAGWANFLGQALQFTPAGADVMHAALQAARDADVGRIRVDHVLIGLLEAPDTAARQTLVEMGLSADALRGRTSVR